MEIQLESKALLTQEQIVEQLRDLAPRQRAWYQVYRYSLNATDAARRAGYSGSYSVLKARGYKNAHNPKLETLVADAVRRYHMTTDEIMARLAEQARADVTNFIRIVEVGGERVAILDVAKGTPKAMRIRLYLTHYSYSGPSGGLWAVSLGELNGSVYSLPPRIGHPPPCHEK